MDIKLNFVEQGSRLAILPGDHFVARRNYPDFNKTVLEFLAQD